MRRVVVVVVGMEVVEHPLPPFLQTCVQTGRHGTGVQPRITDGGVGNLFWCGREGREAKG